VELRSVLELTRKWLWLLLLASFIGGAVGLVVDTLLPKVYQADVTLFVSSPNHSDYSSLLGDQEAAKALASFPQSNTVLNTTLQTVSDRSLSLSQLASMVSVDNASNSQFVYIHVRDSDPKRAAVLASVIGKQSIVQFQMTQADTSKAIVQNLQQEINELEIEIKTQEQSASALEVDLTNAENHPLSDPNQQAAHIEQLTFRLTQLNDDLNGLRQERSQLISSYLSTSNVQVTLLQDAQVPQKPAGVGRSSAIAIGALVGLIAIVGVIIFIEQTDDILRTPDKVDQATGLSTVIAVEHVPSLTKNLFPHNGHHKIAKDISPAPYSSTPKIVVEQGTPGLENGSSEFTDNDTTLRLPRIAGNPLAKVADNYIPSAVKQAPVVIGSLKIKEKTTFGFPLPGAFLTLGAFLMSERSHGSDAGPLLITSPENGDGKTITALQIALGLARIGAQVVLVDANLRKPQVHDIFGLSNRVGLSSILTTSDIDDPTIQIADLTFAAVQETREPNLAVLPGGPAVDSPSEVLSSPRMTTIINQLCKRAFVVIDAPAILASSEPVILASMSSHVLIVVNARHTALTKLKRTVGILSWININILGVVLNEVGQEY
jgi:protein-tyrosine kinase